MTDELPLDAPCLAMARLREKALLSDLEGLTAGRATPPGTKRL